jgi:lysophospholipase L1-like esterase
MHARRALEREVTREKPQSSYGERSARVLAYEEVVSILRTMRMVLLMRRLLCAFVAVLLWTAGFPRAPEASADPLLLAKTGTIRVMALGDSITAGVGPHGSPSRDGGYRGELGALLERDGYKVAFVGSRTDDSAGIVNRAHEGWPGYVVRSFPSDPGPGQLYGALVRSALQRADPDVVLLMAGTNDLLRLERHVPGYTLPAILTSMNLLIGEIVAQRPNAIVVVAPVVASPRIGACTLRDFTGDDPCSAASDGGLHAIADAYAERGARVAFVPAMASAVPRDRDHFPDGIHPTGAAGYDVVASVWFSAIAGLTQAPEKNVAADETSRNEAR